MCMFYLVISHWISLTWQREDDGTTGGMRCTGSNMKNKNKRDSLESHGSRTDKALCIIYFTVQAYLLIISNVAKCIKKCA